MIDDESLVKTRTNTCLSYTSAILLYILILWLGPAVQGRRNWGGGGGRRGSCPSCLLLGGARGGI